MKIYFSGAIRGGREDVRWYSAIVAHLQKYGEVLSAHVADPNLDPHGEELSDKEIHDRDIAWVSEADVLVAEATVPSHGVGYEIAHAVLWKKPVLCLYRLEEGKRLSGMLSGSRDIMKVPYRSVEEALQQIDAFFTDLLRRSE